MARVPYLDAEDLPEQHRDLLKRKINLHRALVNSPDGARAFSGVRRLDPLRQQARYAAARTRDPAGRVAGAQPL